jgi:uncharacterized membrane protein
MEVFERVAAAQATDSVNITAVVSGDAPSSADTAIVLLGVASPSYWMNSTNALLAAQGLSAAAFSIQVTGTTVPSAADDDSCAPACIVAPIVVVVVIVAVVVILVVKNRRNSQGTGQGGYEAAPVLNVPLQEVPGRKQSVY